MCLAVPGRIKQTETIRNNRVGQVDFGGITRPVFLDLVPEANTGDYVVVHVGFAISKVDEAEAVRTLDHLRKTGELQRELAVGSGISAEKIPSPGIFAPVTLTEDAP